MQKCSPKDCTCFFIQQLCHVLVNFDLLLVTSPMNMGGQATPTTGVSFRYASEAEYTIKEITVTINK